MRRVLIVEDDRALCAALARLARSWGTEVWQAHSVAEARQQMDQHPDLLIVDVKLPDGDALEIVEMASHAMPAPAIVAMSGAASPEEAFRLGQLGVRAYVAKPFSVESLTAHVDAALHAQPNLAWILQCVGQRALGELLSEVRRVMFEQAVALAAGNRSEAARLLQVSRQAVQQVMRDRGPSSDSHDAPTSSC